MSQIAKVQEDISKPLSQKENDSQKKKVPTKKKKKSAFGIWFFVFLILISIGGALIFLIPDAKNMIIQSISNAMNSNANPVQVSQLPAENPPNTADTTNQKIQQPKAVTSTKAPADITSKAVESPQTSTDENYIAIAKDLAKTYAAMSPSKAAAILEKQSTESIVYAMTEMSTDERSQIWSKMDAGVVENVSNEIKPKSLVTNKDLAAIQKQIRVQAKNPKIKSIRDLANLYSDMPVNSAAKLILQMMKTDPATTTKVIKQMKGKNQSNLLTAMSSSSDTEMVSMATKIIQAFEK